MLADGGKCPWCDKFYEGVLAYHICPDGSTFEDRGNKSASDYANRNSIMRDAAKPKPEDRSMVHLPNKNNVLQVTKSDLELLKKLKIKIDSDIVEVKR